MRVDDKPPLAVSLDPRDIVSHYFAIKANFKGKT